MSFPPWVGAQAGNKMPEKCEVRPQRRAQACPSWFPTTGLVALDGVRIIESWFIWLWYFRHHQLLSSLHPNLVNSIIAGVRPTLAQKGKFQQASATSQPRAAADVGLRTHNTLPIVSGS